MGDREREGVTNLLPSLSVDWNSKVPVEPTWADQLFTIHVTATAGQLAILAPCH